MPAITHHEDLGEQERIAFRQLYFLCYLAMGGLDIPGPGEGLTDAQLENMRNKIMQSAYRIATGVSTYIEHITRKTTITYDPDRSVTDDEPITATSAYIPIFESSFEGVLEARYTQANMASAATYPDVMVDDEVE